MKLCFENGAKVSFHISLQRKICQKGNYYNKYLKLSRKTSQVLILKLISFQKFKSIGIYYMVLHRIVSITENVTDMLYLLRPK